MGEIYLINMEPTELFRKTLSFFLEERGRGSQKDLADRTGVPSSLINDFIKGRKAISELKKMTYQGLLILNMKNL